MMLLIGLDCSTFFPFALAKQLPFRKHSAGAGAFGLKGTGRKEKKEKEEKTAQFEAQRLNYHVNYHFRRF